MPWLFLEPPTHLLEKTDAPLTRQTYGEHRPGLPGKEPGVVPACGAAPVSIFPLPAAVLTPQLLPGPSVLPSQLWDSLPFREDQRGAGCGARSYPGPPYTAGSAGESCLLGCFHHYDSVFFNVLPVFSVKTGIETSTFSSHYICLIGFASNPRILIKPFLDDSLYRLPQCKWRDP